MEHAGWERLAAGYEIYFRDLAGQMVDPILDAADVIAGKRVLDLCCGPGYVAARARDRGASPIGVDYSSEMIALAKEIIPIFPFTKETARACSLPIAHSMPW